MVPARRSTLRIRLLPMSQTRSRPPASNVMLCGCRNCAFAAGPPSPLEADTPVPATVPMIFVRLRQSADDMVVALDHEQIAVPVEAQLVRRGERRGKRRTAVARIALLACPRNRGDGAAPEIDATDAAGVDLGKRTARCRAP